MQEREIRNSFKSGMVTQTKLGVGPVILSRMMGELIGMKNSMTSLARRCLKV